MTYDLHEHRHRFSVWAAARAAQRGSKGAKLERLRDAVENCGIIRFVRDGIPTKITDEEFEQLHRVWCRSIINFLRTKHLTDFAYGRAAKLIAIYLKSMVILGPGLNSALARAIHPPIDSILLKRISKCEDIHSSRKAEWKLTKWTKLNEQEYYQLILELRQSLSNGEAFWMLERFWTVTEEKVARVGSA
jgi:hypothetical protein